MKQARQNGSIIASILIILVFLSSMLFSLIILANGNLYRARSRILLLQAQYAAESAADSAIAQLNSGNDSYSGTTSDVTLLTSLQYKATYGVSVAAGTTSKEKVITATGKLFSPANASTATYTRRIRVTVQRSSTTTASAILSRNIIDVDSGVKNIKAKDIYINGYIMMHKNTTNLVAENVTIAGKNTGAGNCSIDGTGNIVKPSSFTTPGQTKTKLTLAYNNCISPPGNTSNSSFDVLANQTNVSQLQSIYIPWSQYMDNDYGNANNCSAWTSGGTTRNIPASNGSKLTHYPDSGSNVSTSCGSSGDIDLGSNRYNINANTHVRASLCAATACSPTFYNPDSGASGTKYVFVEGTINLDSIQTVSGSGPIVFIAYGADPSSKSSICPYGGAIYLGNGGNTSAPAAFLLAMNGLCLDKTKFGADPALGGIAGKNVYVSTNSGSPFDLQLDKSFPVSEIPVDLAWRAMRYQRL